MKHFLFVVLAGTLAFSCAQEVVDETSDPPEAVPELAGDTGKADGVFFKVKDYFKHTRELLLRDLVDRAASLATDELNDALGAIPYADLKLSETALFGLEAGYEGGSEISSISDLKAGLTQRFGETDFVTQINGIREAHLAQTDNTVFAESEFKVQFDGATSFRTDVEEVDLVFGFRPVQTLKARVVRAYPGNVSAILQNPVKAAIEARGFALPRSLNDLSKLSQGEAISLVGEGSFGMNFAANLPIFSFDPVNHLVLSARFSLGARIQLAGTLDVQLIRGESDLLYLDVGITKATLKGVRAALTSGWGLTDFPELLSVSVGSHSFSLGDIAEKVIKNFINKKGLLSYGIEGVAEGGEERITITRFRIRMNTPGDEVGAAVEQAVAGDLRLAQALADRPASGVEAMVSLERTVQSRRRYAGAHLISMRFFKETQTAQGSIYIDDGHHAQEVLFDRVKKSTGKFWATWGYRRLLVTSQTWTGGEFTGATANLRLSVTEADKFTDRDQTLDHVDAALLSVIDFDTVYQQLTVKYEELQHIVDLHCEECDDEDNDPWCEDEYEECIEKQITAEEAAAWKTELETLTGPIASGLDNTGYTAEFDSASTLAQELLDLKLTLSSVTESVGAFSSITGRTAILSDARITQRGLNLLFRTVDGPAFETRLKQVLTLIVSKRSKEHDKKFEKALDWLDDEEDKLTDMRQRYEAARKHYLALDDVSHVRLADEAIGDSAFILTDADPGDEVAATIRSLAEQKGSIAADMFDDLVDRADDLGLIQAVLKIISFGLADTLGFESHHLVAYTLVSLVEPAEREWLVSMDFESDGISDVNAYMRGTSQGFIEAGEFDLNLLLGQ